MIVEPHAADNSFLAQHTGTHLESAPRFMGSIRWRSPLAPAKIRCLFVEDYRKIKVLIKQNQYPKAVCLTLFLAPL
jgi:hypothetical protein